MKGPLNNEIKNLENQINIHKVRLLFTFYDSDGKISSLIREKGESGRPPLDFYEKGYKADDFFENIKFLYQDFNNSSRRNSQDAILEKSEGLLSISQIQAIVFYEKLVSLHFEFNIIENSNIKRLICNQLYENGERLLDILKEAVRKAHYEFLLSDNEFTLSISQGNIKPVFSMIAEYVKQMNFVHYRNFYYFYIIENFFSLEEIFQNTNYITYNSLSYNNEDNINELIRQEEIIAQNIFTCFKEFDNVNINIAYSQEYIKKLVEFLVVGNRNNEEVLIKSFLGFRKNGVLIVRENNNNSNNTNDEIMQLASASLSALNFISLVVSLIQTLDAALVKKIIEFRRKEKPLDLLLEEIEDIYYHIVLINPYIIKHTASITTWSIPEQLVLLKYNIVENIINTINSMYLNSIKRYNSLRDLLRKRF